MNEPTRAEGALLFALSDAATVSGEMVTRTGKFFEVGHSFTDMSGKEFMVTEAEADANLPKFSGGPINVEHMPTVFSGLLGQVTRAWREGKDILAEFVIPKWLHEATKAEPLKISSEWNMTTKMPTGAAIVLNPAVSDAVMMAAFASSKYANTAPMQSLHDSAVENGAECAGKALFNASGETAQFITPALLKAIQHVHDHAAANGASCDLHATRKSMYGYYRATDDTSNTNHSNTNQTNQTPVNPAQENKPMVTTWDEVKAFFAELGKPGTGEAAASLVKPDPATLAELAQMRGELAAEKAKRETAEAARFAEGTAAQLEKDTAWIKSQIHAFKILPAVEADYLKLAAENPAAFAAQKPLIEKSLPIAAVAGNPAAGGNGAAFRAAQSGGGDADQLIQMAQERMKDTKEGFSAAFSAVCKLNPALAEAHRTQAAGTQAGN